MQFEARKFNQDAYDSHDGRAKVLFSDFLERHGHTIIKSHEDYDHDIVTDKDGETFYFELEVKLRYPFTNSKSFRFGTVSFLGRKKRLHMDKPFFYVIICDETNWALVCKSEEIFKDNYLENVMVSSVGRSGADQMYRVPKNKCTFFNLASVYA
jgi:hypothetical protein